MTAFNVYRWRTAPVPHAELVWMGDARHAPDAEGKARAAHGRHLRRERLIVRRADADPYALDPRDPFGDPKHPD